jgi:hypothetical protein
MPAVWVLDTSSLVEMKHVALADQWEIFKAMEAMVEGGELALARHVVREVSKIDFPDVPGAWANGMASKLYHPAEASYAVLEEVMTVAGNVVGADDPGDPADPYVLALALELSRSGQAITVVSEDRVDRLPLKISMRTGCALIGLPWCRCSEFLETVRANVAALAAGQGDTLPF